LSKNGKERIIILLIKEYSQQSTGIYKQYLCRFDSEKNIVTIIIVFFIVYILICRVIIIKCDVISFCILSPGLSLHIITLEPIKNIQEKLRIFTIHLSLLFFAASRGTRKSEVLL